MEPLPQVDPDYSTPNNGTSNGENMDAEDGWGSGGRAPPLNKDELKYFMRCESLCCSTSAGKLCYDRGINRCLCCFEGMDSLS